MSLRVKSLSRSVAKLAKGSSRRSESGVMKAAAASAAKSPYRTVQTSRLYEQIVDQIEESILTGVLNPGDQLPAERELAEQFGVSRTAVREATKALREKGLVESYSGRGTFITDGTSQTIRQSLDRMMRIGQQDSFVQLAEVRAILEPGIAALAAQRIDDSYMNAMREAYAIMDRSRNDPDAFIEADLDFHLALAEAADNSIILSLIDSIVGVLREQRLRIFKVKGGAERGQFHHKKIMEAIENRDPEKAMTAMRNHLQQVKEDSKATPAPSKAKRDSRRSLPS